MKFKAQISYLNKDTLVIITPPYKDDKKAFYYNQKINNLIAMGTLTFGKEEYQLNKLQGVLDWGRGVWTRDNTWYWSSMSTILPDGSPFGFNLGYGFGDTSAASENMAFYKGKAYKLNDVDFGLTTIISLMIGIFKVQMGPLILFSRRFMTIITRLISCF